MNPSFDPSQDYRFMIGITGKINSQSLSMQPSKVVDGQISIMENLF
jgi:hypothetical protein